jgi:magnesium-transporting ATPase (P-type)
MDFNARSELMMYNYIIVRISCAGVCFLLFCAGTCLGGIGAIIFGIMYWNMPSIFSGMFFGLLFGIFSAILGFIYATVFNLLAPILGGLAVQIEPQDNPTIKLSNSQPGKQNY